MAELPANEIADIYTRRQEFAYRFSQKWKEAGISALLTPSWPHCSMKAEKFLKWDQMEEYLLIWNILHYPAGIIPITQVAEDE